MNTLLFSFIRTTAIHQTVSRMHFSTCAPLVRVQYILVNNLIEVRQFKNRLDVDQSVTVSSSKDADNV